MLSDLQTLKLTRYFQVYDVNEDGLVGVADFERVVANMRVLHGAIDRSEQAHRLRAAYMGHWEALRASADVDRDGGVDLDEWLAYWELVLADDRRYEAEVEAIVDRLFRAFDTDGDDRIGSDEFCNFFAAFGLESSLGRSVFVELDTDQDGALSRSELLDIGQEFYRGNDPEAAGNLLFGPIGL